MSPHENLDGRTALFKVLWTWLLVGLSQMTPLQWAQMLAALGAFVYSIVQTYVLWRNRDARRAVRESVRASTQPGELQ